jgi:hypothetical protein
VKHFKTEAKLMLLIPAALILLALLVAILLPWMAR